MKIKTFTAPTAHEAMANASEALGIDAIIISTQNTPDHQVMVTAAIDDNEEILFAEDNSIQISDNPSHYHDKLIREGLEYHGTLDLVRDRILSKVRSLSLKSNIIDDQKLLTMCFEQMFDYKNILDPQNPIKIFMGTPGSGKSTAISKAAVQAIKNDVACCIISADNVRAGANKQLEAFANILEVDFYFCKSDRNLYDLLQKANNTYQLVLIDTPGINPFISAEVDKVCSISESAGGEGILVMPSGMNTCEAAEIADVFTGLGAKNLLPTRMDLTRRIGSILTVASCCELSLGAASVSANIGNGLAEVSSQTLAKLVLGIE